MISIGLYGNFGLYPIEILITCLTGGMVQIMKKMIFLSVVILFSFSAYASDFPDESVLKSIFRIDSDSGIKGPPYQKIVDEMKDLERTYPGLVKVIEYGKSVGGRSLTLVKLQTNSTEKLPAIYIGGSIHGDEYLNIEDRLPRWLAEQFEIKGVVSSYLKRGGTIYLAPILNPDGYDGRNRENDMGVDLNRDFTVKEAGVVGLKQPETFSLANFLEQDLKRDNRTLEVALDYHCCIGALLYPWSFQGPVLPRLDVDRHLKVAEAMKSSMGPEIKYGQTPVILGYSARGTSKDFYYERFGATGFTFEGRRNREDKYFEEHTQMWTKIIAGLLPEK
jgi:hypothetical protein